MKYILLAIFILTSFTCFSQGKKADKKPEIKGTNATVQPMLISDTTQVAVVINYAEFKAMIEMLLNSSNRSDEVQKAVKYLQSKAQVIPNKPVEKQKTEEPKKDNK